MVAPGSHENGTGYTGYTSTECAAVPGTYTLVPPDVTEGGGA